MSKPYKFTDVGEGSAKVHNRSTGQLIGHVRYQEKSWNLRRLYISRWWNAIAMGRKIGEYRTRSEAASALLAHSRRDPMVQRVFEAAACVLHSEAYNRNRAEERARAYLAEAVQLGAQINPDEHVDANRRMNPHSLFRWCQATETSVAGAA